MLYIELQIRGMMFGFHTNIDSMCIQAHFFKGTALVWPNRPIKDWTPLVSVYRHRVHNKHVFYTHRGSSARLML